MHALLTIDHILGRAMRGFCIVNLLALTLVLAGVVFIRFFDVHMVTSNADIIEWFKLSWSDEIIEWLMSSLIFVAGAALWRDREHFKIDAVADKVAGTLFGRVFTFCIEILAAAFILAFTVYSFELTTSVGRSSPILAWPMSWWYAPMPFAGAIMFIYSIRNLAVQLDGLLGFGWFIEKAKEQ